MKRGKPCVFGIITYVTAYPSRHAVRRNVAIFHQSNRRCPTSETLAQLVALSHDIATTLFSFFSSGTNTILIYDSRAQLVIEIPTKMNHATCYTTVSAIGKQPYENMAEKKEKEKERPPELPVGCNVSMRTCLQFHGRRF